MLCSHQKPCSVVWGSESDPAFEGVLDEANFTRYRPDVFKYAFDGFIEWRVLKGDKAGQSAAERIRGFLYDDSDQVDAEKRFHFYAMGYKLVEGNVRVVGHDGYDIFMDPKANKIVKTHSMGHGLDWKHQMTLTRVATRNELIDLLKARFGGIGDLVKIISDLLHHFEYPKNERVNDYSFKRMLKKMGEREPWMKALFIQSDH